MENYVDAIVESRQGPETGWPDDISYTIVPADQNRWRFRFAGMTPVTRGSDNADVVAAKPGTRCVVRFISGDVQLHLLEGTPFAPCQPGPGGEQTEGIVARALRLVGVGGQA